MNEYAHLIHYGVIIATVIINAISVGIGEGLASLAALKAINTQPTAKNDIMQVSVIGMAIIETAAIIGVSLGTLLLISQPSSITYFFSIAELGIAAALCLPGLCIGIVSAIPTYAACNAMARQPFFAPKIIRFMLVTQSFIQTPIIFGFIVALFIKAQTPLVTTLPHALMCLASGLSIGLGSIGPALGMGIFAKKACQAIGINRDAYGKIFSFTFFTEAIIETPIIFALVIAIMLITQPVPTGEHALLIGIAYISGAFCMGLGTLGPGISSGKLAASVVMEITERPAVYTAVSRLSLVGQGLIDTCAIYALIGALLLIH